MLKKLFIYLDNKMKDIYILITTLMLSLNLNAQCILDDEIVVAPAPVGGTYQAGQTITFTYTINDYQGLSTNWFHGMAVVLGTAWDATTLTPFGVPTNNTGTGVWLWVNMVQSSATGLIVNNSGWFYDTPSGGFLDGNPGNNWGDGMNGPWTFQFQVTVGDCPPNTNGDDLSIIIENYADGETGSWINLDCQADPNETFNATLECCPPIITGNITHN
jgi:hypothetical protein